MTTSLTTKTPLPDFLAEYQGIEDEAVPSIKELHMLYSLYGEIVPHEVKPTSFAVRLTEESLVALKLTEEPLSFCSREDAWQRWLDNREGFESLVKRVPF